MSIVNHHIDQDGELEFDVESQGFTEKLTVDNVLAIQCAYNKAHLPIYQYFNENPPQQQQQQQQHNGQTMPVKLHTMILDYIDVGHIHAALEIMETCFSTGYIPTPKVVLALMDILLKRTEIKNTQQRKDRVEQYFKAQALLLQILEHFGPGTLSTIWTKFAVNDDKKGKHRDLRSYHTTMNSAATDEYDDDDIEDERGDVQHGARLSRFADFWDLARYCFSSPTSELSFTKLGCRLALEVLIKLMRSDLRSRRDQKDKLSECLLLQTISMNAYGERTNYDRYLDIIFAGINSSTSSSNKVYDTYVGNIDHAMELLNMLILLSYCDYNLLTNACLVDQTYRRILTLNVHTLGHVLPAIQYPLFTSCLCDLYFEDADTRYVRQDYQVYKSSKRQFSVNKMKRYIFKTCPPGEWTAESISYHCTMVIWRWHSHLRASTYRVDLATGTKLTNIMKRRNQKGYGADDMAAWKRHIEAISKDGLNSTIVNIMDMMELCLE
ncbi:hypothetical protein BC941DRAFT_502573 [Chlamydoabsidia padenii]|nr:hypothetical protein BC941DRAFT_502573 [Chlamydoabsidia padenii]